MNDQKFQLGVVAAALSGDARQAAQLARADGFEGLLLEAFSSSLNIPELSGSGRRELRHVLSSNDQQLVGLSVDVGPKGFGPGADVDRVLARFEEVMEAAREMAAPVICAEIGPLPEPAREEKPKPQATQDQAGLLILPSAPKIAAAPTPAARPADLALAAGVDEALAELGRRADRFGVTLALRSELASFAALSRALDTAACPWFFVDFDPVSMLRDAWDADEIFSTLGPLIRHVRGRDAIGGADRRTRPAPIGRGSVEWPQLSSNLDAAGYRGWITIDPTELADRRAAAVAGAEHLRSVMREA